MRLFFRLPRDPQGVQKADVELDLDPSFLVEFIRKKVEKKEGIECNKLIFKGVTLNDGRALSSYDVQEGDMLIVQTKTFSQYRTANLEMSKRRLQEAELPASKRPNLAEIQTSGWGSVMEAVLTSKESPISFTGECALAGEKGTRKTMEDEGLICPSLRLVREQLPEDWDFAVFGIFDGHGGHKSATFTRMALPFELALALEQAAEESEGKPPTDRAVKEAVRQAFLQLDQRIATELPSCSDGTTASVALVRKDVCIVATLGDSLAYVARQDDKSGELLAIPLFKQQHKCWVLGEKERIQKTGGRVENGRVNGILDISRSLGDIPFKKYGVTCAPELMKFSITGEDSFIILGCDGFWNAWSAEDACEHVQGELDARKMQDLTLPQTTRNLVKHVVEERHAQDNVSCLIIDLKAA